MSIFRKSVEKIQVPWKYDKNNGYFTWRPKHILIITRPILLRMRNVLDTSCTENQNTHFMFHNPFSENPSVYEIVCGKYGTAKQATNDNKTRRRPFTCWLRPYTHTQTHTHTHTEYVAPIAFPWQQRLRERASMSRYTYIACLLLECISFRSVSLVIPQYNIFFNQLPAEGTVWLQSKCVFRHWCL